MRKHPPKIKTSLESKYSSPPVGGMLPQVPLSAVFSFLKDTRGIVSWADQDLIRTLHLTRQDAGKILTVLQMQGYVTQTESGEWLTTGAGESVSGSNAPRFKLEQVHAALSLLAERMRSVNQEKSAEFKIVQAVAFGDFLLKTPKCQTADVGIELVARKQEGDRQKFLKNLNPKNLAVKVKPFEEWMSQRTHSRLL